MRFCMRHTPHASDARWSALAPCRRARPPPSTGSSEYWNTPRRSKRSSRTKSLSSSKSFLGLTRTGNQRGAEREPRHALAQLAHQPLDEGRVAAPLRRRKQQPVGGVLQGHVQVLGNLRLARHELITHLGRRAGRRSAGEATARPPSPARRAGGAAWASPRGIVPVGGEVLGHEVQLAHALSGQVLGLLPRCR